MAGAGLKGALISFMPSFVGALPNVVVFQINPESITHTWTPAAPPESPTPTGQPAHPPPPPEPLAVRGLPGETFGFTLALDANDEIADAARNPPAAAIASVTGVYARLAALEMLQYPLAAAGAGLLGTVSASISASGISVSVGGPSGTDASVPRMQVPVVLFVWGPQRIVPVRVTGLTITEKLYDSALNPVHADVQITLRVLTPDEMVQIKGPMKTIANAAYTYTQGLRQVQATANLGAAAGAILGMLPTPF